MAVLHVNLTVAIDDSEVEHIACMLQNYARLREAESYRHDFADEGFEAVCARNAANEARATADSLGARLEARIMHVETLAQALV